MSFVWAEKYHPEKIQWLILHENCYNDFIRSSARCTHRPQPFPVVIFQILDLINGYLWDNWFVFKVCCEYVRRNEAERMWRVFNFGQCQKRRELFGAGGYPPAQSTLAKIDGGTETGKQVDLVRERKPRHIQPPPPPPPALKIILIINTFLQTKTPEYNNINNIVSRFVLKYNLKPLYQYGVPLQAVDITQKTK